MRRQEEKKEWTWEKNVIYGQEYTDICNNYGAHMRPQSLSLVATRSVKFVQKKINKI